MISNSYVRGFNLIFCSLLLVAESAVCVDEIVQKSSGNCSPNAGTINGDLYISCNFNSGSKSLNIKLDMTEGKPTPDDIKYIEGFYSEYSEEYVDRKIEKDHYLVFLDIKFRSMMEQYNTESVLSNTPPLSINSNNPKFKVFDRQSWVDPGRYSTDNLRIIGARLSAKGDELSWSAVVSLDKPIRTNEFSFNFNGLPIQIDTDEHLKFMEEKSDDGTSYFVAKAQVNIAFDEPNWPILQSARFLRTADPKISIIELKVTNFSRLDTIVDDIFIHGALTNPFCCCSATYQDGPLIKIKWNVKPQIKSANEVYLEYDDIKLRGFIKTWFMCSNGAYFDVHLPWKHNLQSLGTDVISLVIEEESNEVIGEKGAPALRRNLREWNSVHVGIQPPHVSKAKGESLFRSSEVVSLLPVKNNCENKHASSIPLSYHF